MTQEADQVWGELNPLPIFFINFKIFTLLYILLRQHGQFVSLMDSNIYSVEQ